MAEIIYETGSLNIKNSINRHIFTASWKFPYLVKPFSIIKSPVFKSWLDTKWKIVIQIDSLKNEIVTTVYLIPSPDGSENIRNLTAGCEIKIGPCILLNKSINSVPTFNALMQLTAKGQVTTIQYCQHVLKDAPNYLTFTKLGKVYVDIQFTVELQNACCISDYINFFQESNSDILFSQLYDEDIPSDFKILVDGKTLKAHRCVLAAFSSVFKAMFEHDLDNNEIQQLVINDFNYDVVNDFLKYLYLKKSPAFTITTAMDFYRFCEKFNVSALKMLCKKYIIAEVNKCISGDDDDVLFQKFIKAFSASTCACGQVKLDKKSSNQSESAPNEGIEL